MDSRREFLKTAAIFSGGIGLSFSIPGLISKITEIEPDPGTTFYDAEHVVFLMQENRSFDHYFGNLKGVRGFNDPRAQILPNQNKVWLQNDEKGLTYAPFRMDLKNTKITWQGGLPHNWDDQLAASNGGRHDNWIPSKTDMCMGFYKREDIPFYYALADAFTVCDHNFCSSLTGTTPNRLFYFTGTNRKKRNGKSKAVVTNDLAESRTNQYVDWQGFPEVLEDNDISWKIYQNEVWTANLQDENNDNWLGNYGDNPLEYVRKYQVKLSAYFRKNGDHTNKPALTADQVLKKYNRLSEREKNLIDKAFTTNIESPEDYLEMTPFSYKDEEMEKKEIQIPQNDLFYQFRKDVDQGILPTVSWLVAPQKFSDHTSSPLYGTWYVSEALDILAKNPEVFKKTIFVLTYDENDGYFDHVPPFVAPKHNDYSQGKVSSSINTKLDYENKKDSTIGLGFRVPMLIVSPWSKGGFVNSQVFDHTSSLQFLENFLSKKTKKEIRSKNISSWRRAICGDLTSAFRPFSGEKISIPEALKQGVVINDIQQAKTKPFQKVGKVLTEDQISLVNESQLPNVTSILPHQEKGIKKSCSLPYQIFVDSQIEVENKIFIIDFVVSKSELGIHETTVGAPFQVYTPKTYGTQVGKSWSYASVAGDQLRGEWEISKFENEIYDLYVNGPNGFFRRFKGDLNDPLLHIKCLNQKGGILKNRVSGNIFVEIENKDNQYHTINVVDNSYKSGFLKTILIAPNSLIDFTINLQENHHWYDFTIKINGNDNFLKQYAGHIETGKDSMTDPFMGGIV